MEDDTYPALNGMKVTNNRGTFYFSEPGNWIDEDGWPIYEKLHREDGPAAEKADGTKWWYVNGKLHREDGPAIEYADGDKSWFLNGVLYTEQKWKEKLKPCKGKKVTVDGVEYTLE